MNFTINYHVELERVESIGDLSADSKCSEQLPQLLETTEPDIQKKKGKLNLRKSLAWNSAFFESPGLTFNQIYDFCFCIVTFSMIVQAFGSERFFDQFRFSGC